MDAARHEFEEHTSEVRVHLRAPDLPGLYREAGVALAELMAPEARAAGEGAWEPVELQSRDPAALLVDWVDELIYRVDTTGQVFAEIAVDRADATSLHARVRGSTPPEFKTAVKAATFHGLEVERTDDGWEAHLVLDV
jgi:SHS2 domain-containing protein